MNQRHREQLLTQLASPNPDEQLLARDELYQADLDDELAEKFISEFDTPEERTAWHEELENYRAAGSPYGNSWSDFRRWSKDQDPLIDPEDDPGDLDHKAERDAEKAAERADNKVTDEAASRAADEGMIDRKEEQLIRAEEAYMNADLDDIVDQDK